MNHIIRQKIRKMIGQKVKIYIDRPIGSKHPKYDEIIYPINYGYIREIIAEDNEFQDAYLLGVNEPVQSYEGIVYAIVERENDLEDKLIIVANNNEFTIEEIEELVNFQEKFFKHKIYMCILHF